jgi:hypothetical protein
MKLICYALSEFAPKIIPAEPQRPWMDEFPDRHAYRCLPMTIANTHGWEVLCPLPVEINWNGGPRKEDLVVRTLKPSPSGHEACSSHFSNGIVTFNVGYIFRTDPEWDLLATGPFNAAKDNASPLTGIMETDWLPYPFTMNWQVLRPGRVVFEEGEPFCLIFPVRKQALVACTPEIRQMSEEAELSRQYELFKEARTGFMQRLQRGDVETMKQAWQKYYFRGAHPDGTKANLHVQKLRLAQPTVMSADAGPHSPREGLPSNHATGPVRDVQEDPPGG